MTYNHDLFHSSLQRFLIFIRESLGGGFFIYSMKAYKIAILKSLDMSMILLPFLAVSQMYCVLNAVDRVTIFNYTTRLYLWANHFKIKKQKGFFLKFSSETKFDLAT